MFFVKRSRYAYEYRFDCCSFSTDRSADIIFKNLSVGYWYVGGYCFSQHFFIYPWWWYVCRRFIFPLHVVPLFMCSCWNNKYSRGIIIIVHTAQKQSILTIKYYSCFVPGTRYTRTVILIGTTRGRIWNFVDSPLLLLLLLLLLVLVLLVF